MRKTSFFYRVRRLIPMMACVGLLFSAVHNSLLAQTTTEEEIVVTAEEVPSAYGAPPGLSRSRFSNTTQAYVLPPWAFFFGEIYEGQGFRHGPPDHLFTQESGPPKVPDAYEFRLLLAQDFGEHVEWAMNWFFEKENTGDRGREWGFSQSAMFPVFLPNERLKVGVEMEYKNFTVKDTRGDPMHTFIIGPTVAWKPTAQTRLDISPL